MTKKLLDMKKELESFEEFLFDIDNIVETFTQQVRERGYTLDGTMDTLDGLESYLLNEIAPPPEPEREPLIGWAARYYGGVVINTFGGKWALAIDDPNDLNYGLPVIRGHSKYEVDFPPSEIIRNFLHNQKVGLLRQAVLNDLDPEGLDFSDLIKD